MATHPGHSSPAPTPTDIREAEEFAAPLRREIDRLGWTIAGVAADGRRPSWLYTVGLLHAHRHPEFVLVGRDELSAEILLAHLGMAVAVGRRFHPGDGVEVDGQPVELGWVHPRHFRLDTFDLWGPLMEMCLHHVEPQALQVFPADHPRSGHRAGWVLDRPRRIR